VTEQCHDCNFYRVRTDEPGRNSQGWFGYCVRFPPIFKEDRAINDGWPNVHGQSWCGEFKRSE